MEWKEAIKTYRFNPSNISYVLDLLGDLPTCFHQGITYYNIPCSFDIETSSFYDPDGNKAACMYEWTFGINGIVIIGRTWKQFLTMMKYIVNRLEIDPKHRLVCYIHNLSYEFQWFRKYFTWNKVFSLEERKPIYAVTDTGIEFRCSYLLSGYSLAKLADQLQTYKFKKLVGDLNYDLLRHSRTKLYDNEIAYCINDVRVVMAYIQEKIENKENICYIPKTKTGYVRKFVRNYCFNEYGKPQKKSHKKLRYLDLMHKLTLEPNEYLQLKRAFAGGFTHASVFYTGKIEEDVTSMDFTSSYPTVMIAEMFPMSSSELIEIKSKEEFYHNIKYYCCLFDCHFEGLEATFLYDNYISESHCRNKRNVSINNGRVVSADSLDLTLTEQDYIIISKTYKWKKLLISNFRRYQKDYLPKDFVKAILKLYEKKTTLKGVEGKEREYLSGKENLNACFGATVTDICRPDIIYDGEWDSKEPDINTVIDKYNKSNSRFLFYPWGVDYSLCTSKLVDCNIRV